MFKPRRESFLQDPYVSYFRASARGLVWAKATCFEERVFAMNAIKNLTLPPQPASDTGATRRSTSALVGLVVLVAATVGVALLIGATYPVGAGAGSTHRKLPRATPPGAVFSVVWPVLYTLMAVALWLLLTAAPAHMSADARTARSTAVVFFVVQLALNYGWMPVYDGGNGARAGLYVLLATLASTLVVCFASLGCGQWGSAAALAPYVTWLVFAAFLNAESIGLERFGHRA